MVLSALVLVLPLMMGHRNFMTLSATSLVMVLGALLAAWVAVLPFGRPLRWPGAGWLAFAAFLSLVVLVQVLPSSLLARLLGPYPDAFWAHPGFEPRTWSPNPAATLSGWAVFVALFLIAWLVSVLRSGYRHALWLVIAVSAVFQSVYGLLAHAGGAETIFGIWERNNPNFVHGSFSNRNLFAGYLALTWPLTVAVWWLRDTPVLSALPRELKVAGSVICGAIVGAALIGSASRLGSAAGLAGMFTALVLWTRYRGHISGGVVWPVYLAAFAALIAATWYGLTPLAERLVVTSVEEMRFELFSLMLTEFPPRWWLTGVGLGGFEAAFKLIQVTDASRWVDYAHNDLLQWLIEMGLVGLVLLVWVCVALWRNARLEAETLPLYAGLVALCLVALGDFSWHIPGTQVVLAIYIGALLREKISRK